MYIQKAAQMGPNDDTGGGEDGSQGADVQYIMRGTAHNAIMWSALRGKHNMLIPHIRSLASQFAATPRVWDGKLPETNQIQVSDASGNF